MLVFLAGMVVMHLYRIQNTWIWIGYISLWWVTEMVIIKNVHLRLWIWVLILGFILAINAVVIFWFV